MGHADGRTRLIDVLAAGTGGAEIVDADVVHVEVDFDVFRFRQDGNGCRRRVDTAAGFGDGHALDAVDARFIFQLAIDARAFDGEDDFLEAAQFRCVGTDDARLPSRLFFDVFHVHAEQVAGKEGCFVAAGSGADFHDDVLVIPRVLGQHEDVQLVFQIGLFLSEAVHFFLGHGDEVIVAVGIVDDFLVAVDGAGNVFVFAECFDNRHQRSVFLGQFLPFVLTGDDRRVADLLFQVHEFILYGLDFIHKRAHKVLLISIRSIHFLHQPAWRR